MLKRFAALGLCLLLVTACGGKSSPAAPTPQIPNVVGNYSGSTTFTLPELGQTLTCATSTTVTQSGSTVTVAPLILAGACGGLSIPLGQNTIDNTGAILGQNTGSFFEPSCGGTYNFVGSGGFFGRELRLSINMTSSRCLNINMTISLFR